MLGFGRGVTRASLLLLALGAALPASAGPAADPKLSELTQVVARSASDDITVVLTGSKAPDFTSFTMNAPFRVVVDWAGSRLVDVAEERRFDQGLVRRITTRQFDSESEKISRVTIELARETTYHVEAIGKTVVVHFAPVADPIPEPATPTPAVAVAETKPEPAKTEPEGPLTEPAIAVPSEVPALPKKPAAVAAATTVAKDAAKPAASTVTPVAKRASAEAEAALASAGAAGSRELAAADVAATGAKTEAAKAAPKTDVVAVAKDAKGDAAPADLAKITPAASDLAKVEVAAAKSEPSKGERAKSEPSKSEPSKVEVAAANTEVAAKVEPAERATPKPDAAKAEVVAAKVEPVKVEVAKTAPAKAEAVAAKTEAAKTEPAAIAKVAPAKTEANGDAKVAASEPVRLASFEGPTPEKQPIAQKTEEKPVRVMTPPTVRPERELSPPPQRLASNVPSGRERVAQWQPPSIALPKKLPVVRYASANDGQALKPTAQLPADPDEPATPEKEKAQPEKPVSAKDAKDANDFDPGPRVMKYIGFQQMAEASRVFVRLDGKAKYRPTLEGTSFVLELSSTHINVKNNERMLDTTYFNSPVQKIQAVPAGDTTRIEVKLKEPVPYKIQRIGNTIAIDFQRAK